ncbi:hypothetical protein ABRY95_12235 [Castellaniella ginsengisoli]|uniref:Uncharacterized protein n=1 Tax=Castellaniella ginsengisoli TaxID=546114 RepID=A0AB39FGH9_9BURK
MSSERCNIRSRKAASSVPGNRAREDSCSIRNAAEALLFPCGPRGGIPIEKFNAPDIPDIHATPENSKRHAHIAEWIFICIQMYKANNHDL